MSSRVVRLGRSVRALASRSPAKAGQPAGRVHDDGEDALIAGLLADPAFRERLRAVAAEETDEQETLGKAAAYLREMSAVHNDRAARTWDRLGQWMTRAYDVVIDDEALTDLRRLDQGHPLVFLPAHRSYLDTWSAMNLSRRGIERCFVLGGSNMDFFPFGTLGRRVGLIFIRRSTVGLPIYRLCLRSYIGRLVTARHNLTWAIEGGRTRTGKLRPPRYGLLRYLVEAVEATEGPEVLLVPESVMYDQLHEVAAMAAEARGGTKPAESGLWLARYARSQGRPLGNVYVDFGEPIPLRERLKELRGEDAGGEHVVERVALEVMHRINRATPATAVSIVCVAVAAADRALTLHEVVEGIAPLTQYLRRRGWRIAGGLDLADPSVVRDTLQALTESGVLNRYRGASHTVWHIAPEQHLVAAFYRNGMIHMLVLRAIAELTVLAVTESEPGTSRTALDHALRLRELLKFEFFFPRRREFAEELRAEMLLVDPTLVHSPDDVPRDEAARLLAQAHPQVAHLVLRPFLEAYSVVADQLAGSNPEDAFDEKAFLDLCLAEGQQRVLQRRVASEESVSLEMFRTALRLARHLNLVEPGEPDLRARRREFAEEIGGLTRRVATIGAMGPKEVITR